jgi:outer membrane immunogenic protein
VDITRCEAAIYIGGQVGVSWGDGNRTNQLIAPFGTFANFLLQNLQEVIGGAHGGYNPQFNQWVLGLEGPVDGTS